MFQLGQNDLITNLKEKLSYTLHECVKIKHKYSAIEQTKRVLRKAFKKQIQMRKEHIYDIHKKLDIRLKFFWGGGDK